MKFQPLNVSKIKLNHRKFSEKSLISLLALYALIGFKTDEFNALWISSAVNWTHNSLCCFFKTLPNSSKVRGISLPVVTRVPRETSLLRFVLLTIEKSYYAGEWKSTLFIFPALLTVISQHLFFNYELFWLNSLLSLCSPRQTRHRLYCEIIKL